MIMVDSELQGMKFHIGYQPCLHRGMENWTIVLLKKRLNSRFGFDLFAIQSDIQYGI